MTQIARIKSRSFHGACILISAIQTYVVIDMDHPRGGLIKVPHRSLTDLQKSITAQA
jgi:hypothetical protein